MSDIYFIKFDLNDVAKASFMYESTMDQGHFFKGFRMGGYGMPLPPDQVPAFIAGHEFGMKCRNEAENYRRVRAENGKMGGRPKLNVTETKAKVKLNKAKVKLDVTETKAKVKLDQTWAKANETHLAVSSKQTSDSNQQETEIRDEACGMRAHDDLKKLMGMCRKSKERAEELRYEYEAILNEYGHKRTFEAAGKLSWDNRWPVEIRKEITRESDPVYPTFATPAKREPLVIVPTPFNGLTEIQVIP